MSADSLNKQTYLVSGQQTELTTASGKWYVDALFNNKYGQPLRWISDPYLTEEYSVNASTVISYSFPGLNQSSAFFNYTDDVGEITATAFTSQQAIDTRSALEEISKYINVTFVEVTEAEDNVGTIRFGINTITDEAGNYRAGIVATADPPSSLPRGGDVWFNKQFSTSGNFAKGLVSGSETGVADVTVLYHEIFHALGLEHPNDNKNILFQEDKNDREHTVMAGEYSIEGLPSYYFNGTDYSVAATPMVYDIAPLQHLYGANPLYNMGDTTHVFDPETPFVQTLWDASGEDTLDFSNFSKNNDINLNGGTNSTAEGNSNWSQKNILGLAYGIEIENAYGGSGSDTLTGNSLGNILKGNSGDDIIFGNAGDDTIFADGGSDTINGGTGLDTIKYTLTQANYTLALGESSSTVTEISTGANDSFSTIERVVFSDKAVALDIGSGEVGGSCYRIYKAAFNRTPDEGGLGYWIGQMDLGKTLVEVSAGFIDSDEFRASYGTSPSNGEFLTKVYNNVLGRDPDSGGYDWWVDQLANNPEKTWDKVMADFSEGTENQANVLELIGNGVQYDLWVA
ncbi:DUF4214 domain-containing protein [Candidatus Njordibacter sp. Uisw_058]|uniref:DUF4214 domain-containing protein n=1 Tax=Candidatus Njordibacter sp. Uisw_058 TaxID=3230974 RepID=UPI003D4C4B9E